MKKICVIPARGGSKRIPRKNIKDFCGKPIIAYSIEAARNARCFDTIMCSTDDEEIAQVAMSYGAEVPFLRSAETSNDTATTGDVLKEVLGRYAAIDAHFDYLCCIYPCAPFVDPSKIQSGLKLMIEKGALAAMPIARFACPPQWGGILKDDRLIMLDESKARVRSQDLEPIYHDIGQYYWFRTDALESNPDIMLMHPVGIITPENETRDIDTLEDWALAEMQWRILREMQSRS